MPASDEMLVGLGDAVVGALVEAVQFAAGVPDHHGPGRVVVGRRLDVAAARLCVEREPVVGVLRESVQ